MRREHSFTLIELLIVVAIIGVLAAIAVPNFQAALIRAKISRSYADLKALQTSVHTNQIERGVLLVDDCDGLSDWGKDRILNIFDGVGLAEWQPFRTQFDIFAPLTTPIAYLTSIPVSPFGVDAATYFDDPVYWWHGRAFGSYLGLVPLYAYVDNDPEYPKIDTLLPPTIRGRWIGILTVGVAR